MIFSGTAGEDWVVGGKEFLGAESCSRGQAPLVWMIIPTCSLSCRLKHFVEAVKARQGPRDVEGCQCQCSSRSAFLLRGISALLVDIVCFSWLVFVAFLSYVSLVPGFRYTSRFARVELVFLLNSCFEYSRSSCKEVGLEFVFVVFQVWLLLIFFACTT
jgi:hypothetical protein